MIKERDRKSKIVTQLLTHLTDEQKVIEENKKKRELQLRNEPT